MTLDQYQLESDDVFTVFKFISEGPKGRIEKEIQYTKMGVKEIYNLAFGDKNEFNKEIDDKIATNNKDTQKILATVATSVFIFTDKYSEAWVFATGSTESRTRLYRMGISNNLDELEQYFDIYGIIDDKLLKFERNIPFKSFVVKRKK